MKILTNLLLAGMMVAFCCSVGNAQIVYSNDFTGGSDESIHGMAPTVANDFAGGSSSATWNVLSNSAAAFMNADGTIGTNQNTALLSFTPETGFLYTLTATVDFTGNPGNWVDLGFAAHDPAQNAGSAKMTDTTATGPDGNDWMIFTPASGGDQFFAGAGAANAVVSGKLLEGTGVWTVQLDLDTTAPQWVISAFVNGSQVGTDFTYSSNPTITAVGYGENSISNPSKVLWEDIDLTATPTPEPSTLALAGLGLAGMCAFLRRRKQNIFNKQN